MFHTSIVSHFNCFTLFHTITFVVDLIYTGASGDLIRRVTLRGDIYPLKRNARLCTQRPLHPDPRRHGRAEPAYYYQACLAYCSETGERERERVYKCDRLNATANGRVASTPDGYS